MAREFTDVEQYRLRNADLAIRPAVLRRLLGNCRGESILDLGCGDGSLTLPFCHEAKRVVLLDRSHTMLAAAQAAVPQACTAQVDVVRADYSDYSPYAPFDVVVCVGMLAHARSIRDVMAHVAGLTRPGGRCVVQVTDGGRPLGLAMYAAHSVKGRCAPARSYGLNFTTAPRLRELAEALGLSVVRTEHYAVTLPGLNRLPRSLLRTYAAWTVDHPARRLGSEVMILCSRE